MMRCRSLPALLATLSACGAAEPAPPGAQPPAAVAPAPALERPRERMNKEQAEKYALALVNRDRAAHGLGPVGWDAAAARAAERHVRDIARHGVTAHLGTDGSVPEQRYTEAGGDGLVMENVGCFADAKARGLDAQPTFSAEGIERIQAAFMNEVPPADGHRRNVLTTRHTAVGIALAQAEGLDLPCLVQEFVHGWGSYAPLPKRARAGATLRIAGGVRGPARVAGIGISRVDLPRPMKPHELNKTFGYAIPKPYVTYFPKGFKTPIVLDVQGDRFTIDAPLGDDKRAGLYGVSVWATFPGSKELVMISLRTVQVDD
jgi:uncharacterized protein YkwD